MKAQWQKEKEAIRRLRQLKEEIEQVRLQVEQAERNADYARAAELKYGRMNELERQLQEEEAKLATAQRRPPRC